MKVVSSNSTANPQFILIDKPKGITSFDVIWRLRKKLGIKKMGHAGTLDPRATGLLIVALDQDTKKLQEIIGLPKTYEAEILLGVKTDTGDLDGKVIEEHDISKVFNDVSNSNEKDFRKKCEEVLHSMLGEISLPVPLYSAIKKDGKRLYKYAYEGKSENIELPVKTMHVYTAGLKDMNSINPSINFKEHTVNVEFLVSSGTYIRSLAEEFGRRLGTVATLKELRRISIGPYHVRDAREKEILEKI